jgi:hypothetical protein
MPNGVRTSMSPFASAQTVSNARTGSYVGVNTDRQRRFESRAARRYGDWSILEFPTPVLWLDYGWEPILLDEPGEFVVPVLVELWP